MQQNETPVARFLRNYERLNSEGNVAALVALFADPFMAAGPNGVQCVRTEDFARALPKRIELFRSFGCESTSLAPFTEATLDDRFAMVETRWRMAFRREGEAAKEALADGLYLIDMGGATPKIVLPSSSGLHDDS